MKKSITLIAMLLLFTMSFVSCVKDEAVVEKPTLIGKWISTSITNDTYKLTFGSNNSFIMTISMPSQNYNATISGTYTYNETTKIISYSVVNPVGTGISNYENVKFNSISQWQATSGTATLVWNKE